MRYVCSLLTVFFLCFTRGLYILAHRDQYSPSAVKLVYIQDAYVEYQVGGPVLTEDTALEFHAYKGLPGPYMYVTATAHTLLLPTDYKVRRNK